MKLETLLKKQLPFTLTDKTLLTFVVEEINDMLGDGNITFNGVMYLDGLNSSSKSYVFADYEEIKNLKFKKEL